MITSHKLKIFLFTLGITLFTAHSVKAAGYTVVSGDTLYNIGKTFNTNAYTLKYDNKLISDSIYLGQILNVPAKDYTVKSGDTLYLISKANGINVDSLKKANNYWLDFIYVGQRLIIPSTNYSISTASQTVKGVIPYTESDLDLLARLVRAEAEGQPYKAKVAVAAVVVNRVQSSAWPNTIKDVIYQKVNGYYQFSPVLNGYINKPAATEDRQAVLEVLKGYDPTNGAQFYFDDSTTNTWLWSKSIALRIDKMVFSY